MYSFYGGQPGSSFIIITTYRSIADMIAKFKLGSEYTAVHFDQHVMINTVNKNDPDNGKIYRRGYDFNNDMGGAEFVGTIVGPAGHAPMIQLATIAEVKRKAAEEGYEERRSSGSYSVTGANLVPGKKTDGTFNDAITWECCSIRNENDEDSTAYIGFTFPYTVIDVEASTIEPYISGKYADVSGAYRNDDYMHPFYEQWHLDIPKGVKGDAFKNLKVQIADMSIEPYEGQAEDINNQEKVIVYEYYCYDEYKNGAPKKYYLGDYNVIKDITIAADGTITISYNHGGNKTFSKIMKWISSLSLAADGMLTINYNTGETRSITNNKIKWINSVSTENGRTLVFTYNDDTTDSVNLTLPNNISINTGDIEGEGNQKIKVDWTNGDSQDIGNPINYIMQAAIDDNQHLLVRYSDPIRRAQSDTVTWKNKTGWTDIGNLKVPYIYSDPSATDLQWTGLGTLKNSDDTNYMVITFTMPLTQFIDTNITTITAETGSLYITAADTTHNLNDFAIDSTNTTITKTLSGLKFEIQTAFENIQTATSELVTILVNGLDLTFSRQTP